MQAAAHPGRGPRQRRCCPECFGLEQTMACHVMRRLLLLLSEPACCTVATWPRPTMLRARSSRDTTTHAHCGRNPNSSSGCCAGLATLMTSLQRVNGAQCAPWFNGSGRFRVILDTNHRARSAKSRARWEADKDAPNPAVFVGEPSWPRRFWQKPASGYLGLGEKPLQCRGASGGSTPELTWVPHHFQTKVTQHARHSDQVLSQWDEKETKLSEGLPIYLDIKQVWSAKGWLPRTKSTKQARPSQPMMLLLGGFAHPFPVHSPAPSVVVYPRPPPPSMCSSRGDHSRSSSSLGRMCTRFDRPVCRMHRSRRALYIPETDAV